MPETDGTDGAPERIMRATYCALCEVGYASLTMQDIADESDLSKAALHYHYDSKADLLRSFLEYLLESFRERTPDAESAAPLDRVRSLVELLFEPPRADADAEFRTAMLELKAQAPYDERLRERLVSFDAYLREELRSGLADARAAGSLGEDVDPEEVAEFLVTASSGAHTRRVTLDRSTDTAEAALLSYLDSLTVLDGEAEP